MAQFASADELAAFLGTTFDAAQIVQADLLLQLASAAIQGDAHQSLEYVEDDEAVPLKGTYGGELHLPERPVHDVTDVVIKNGSGLPVSLDITTTQFTWDRRGLMRRGPWVGGGVESNADVPWGGWGGPYATVEVTYSHGYETIPDDIKGLCLQVAARVMQGAPVGVTSETTDGYAVTYASDTPKALTLTEDECKIAKRYRPVSA